MSKCPSIKGPATCASYVFSCARPWPFTSRNPSESEQPTGGANISDVEFSMKLPAPASRVQVGSELRPSGPPARPGAFGRGAHGDANVHTRVPGVPDE